MKGTNGDRFHINKVAKREEDGDLRGGIVNHDDECLARK